eukprot:5071776-Karenia_brevis.AAC.1
MKTRTCTALQNFGVQHGPEILGSKQIFGLGLDNKFEGRPQIHKPDESACWARKVQASPGKSRQVGGDEKSWNIG